MKYFWVILAFLCSTNLLAQSKDLTINITGLKSTEGKCIAYVYRSKEGFPGKHEKAMMSATGKIQGNQCTLILKDLAAGDYAIVVNHDENNNNKLDTNFIGMPKEGIGTSNNPKSSFGPPSYQDCVFKYSGTNQTITIRITYL